MLKLSVEQTREEIRMIETHISKLSDLDIVEIQKGQLSRLVYFAKRSVTSNLSKSKSHITLTNSHDHGPPGPPDYSPVE